MPSDVLRSALSNAVLCLYEFFASITEWTGQMLMTRCDFSSIHFSMRSCVWS